MESIDTLTHWEILAIIGSVYIVASVLVFCLVARNNEDNSGDEP